MKKHQQAAVAAAIISALVAASCSSDADDAVNEDDTADESVPAEESVDDSSGELVGVELMLPFPRGIFWTPLLVAEQMGYFEDEGLDLSVVEAAGSGFVMQQLVAGNVDFGFSGAASGVVGAEVDPNVRMPMCYPSGNIFIIVAPEDSGISTVADLEGKTLGITEAGGGEEPIVLAALGEAGLEPGADVTLLPVGDAGPQSLTALENDTIQAYASSFADMATFTASGFNFIDITPESLDVIPGDCLATTASVLEDPTTRAQAAGLLRAFVKGVAFTDANPEGALDIVCDVVPEECTDMNFAQIYFDEVRRVSGSYEAGTPYGFVGPEAWQTTVDVLTGAEVIDGTVDVVAMTAGDDVVSLQQEFAEIDLAAVQDDAAQYGG